jgi:hypothetical protein
MHRSDHALLSGVEIANMAGENWSDPKSCKSVRLSIMGDRFAEWVCR